jgi:hypothetical protein
VKHQGRSIQLILTGCKVFMAGEYAGNVELSLDCAPELESIVQESLRLKNPGEDTSSESIASGGPDDGVMLIFHSEAVALLPIVPESLTFRWCGEQLATVSPELAESVPIEDVQRLIDPLEILGQPEMRTSESFRLGFERDLIWLLLAGMVGGAGLAGSFAPLGLPADLVPYARFAGGLLLLVAAAIAIIAALMPKRQVWFDRCRREVLLLESRTFAAEKRLQNATRGSVDGFAHVRLCKREYAPELADETDATRTDYIVSLEGEIPFAFDDGRVHSRSDALHLATFSSERAARRFAAEVGYHVGLRILIATDW